MDYFINKQEYDFPPEYFEHVQQLYLSYNEHEDVYEILGLKYGLREINIPQEKDTISLINVDFSKLELKNNDTNEFENLQEYIDKYI